MKWFWVPWDTSKNLKGAFAQCASNRRLISMQRLYHLGVILGFFLRFGPVALCRLDDLIQLGILWDGRGSMGMASICPMHSSHRFQYGRAMFQHANCRRALLCVCRSCAGRLGVRTSLCRLRSCPADRLTVLSPPGLLAGQTSVDL